MDKYLENLRTDRELAALVALDEVAAFHNALVLRRGVYESDGKVNGYAVLAWRSVSDYNDTYIGNYTLVCDRIWSLDQLTGLTDKQLDQVVALRG